MAQSQHFGKGLITSAPDDPDSITSFLCTRLSGVRGLSQVVGAVVAVVPLQHVGGHPEKAGGLPHVGPELHLPRCHDVPEDLRRGARELGLSIFRGVEAPTEPQSVKARGRAIASSDFRSAATPQTDSITAAASISAAPRR